MNTVAVKFVRPIDLHDRWYTCGRDHCEQVVSKTDYETLAEARDHDRRLLNRAELLLQECQQWLPDGETDAADLSRRINALLHADDEPDEAAEGHSTMCPDMTPHMWVEPNPPVVATNMFCRKCGFFPGPPISASSQRFAARLRAAEELLEKADAVIEILVGDARHEQADEVCAAIEQHWQAYPEPEA